MDVRQYFPNNPKLKNGIEDVEIFEIVNRYRNIPFTNKILLCLEISTLIGYKENKMQEAAEHQINLLRESNDHKAD